MSLFYLVGLFDLWAGIRTVLISSVGAYVIAKYVDGPLMPWIGFVFLMGHMSINHIHRQFADNPAVLDITGVQMVLVMKLTAFCWNVQDGRLPDKELADFQRERAVAQLPSILDYAAYVLFFPSLFAGPAFDYVDYRRWIETTMFDVPAGTDPSIKPKTRKKRRIPQSHIPATIKLVTGLAWIFLFLQFSPWYNNDLVLSEQYLEYGFLRRVWLLEMLGFCTRMKYYGVWSLTEGACVLAGIGYNGVDPKTGKVDWNRLQNVNPLGVELAQNSRAYLENWNINTNHWLRNYMYLRVTPKGKKPGFRASLATFVTSAFWHGFYPGYYLSFVLAAFLQTVAKSKPPSPLPLRRPTPSALQQLIPPPPLLQTSAATSAPSSSTPPPAPQPPTNPPTTPSATSQPKQHSASPPFPSASSPSRPPSSSGPASTSTPSSAPPRRWRFSPARRRDGSSGS